MRCLALTLVLAATLLGPAPAQARPAVPERAERAAAHVRLDGVAVRLRDGTRQVVTANHTRGHRARVTWWVRRDGRWQRVLQATDGRIGYGGLVAGPRRQQGTGTTPLGTYALPRAFGTHAPASGWQVEYRRIRRGDFWVMDNASDFYNRYRNQRHGGFRWWLPTSDENGSERLTDFRSQYEWSIVIGYNPRQVRHRGAGIFLHVNGSGATAGCVSAPRWFIRSLMGRLDPAQRPVIAIGR